MLRTYACLHELMLQLIKQLSITSKSVELACKVYYYHFVTFGYCLLADHN